jgi:hypothetical protein
VLLVEVLERVRDKRTEMEKERGRRESARGEGGESGRREGGRVLLEVKNVNAYSPEWDDDSLS